MNIIGKLYEISDITLTTEDNKQLFFEKGFIYQFVYITFSRDNKIKYNSSIQFKFKNQKYKDSDSDIITKISFTEKGSKIIYNNLDSVLSIDTKNDKCHLYTNTSNTSINHPIYPDLKRDALKNFLTNKNITKEQKETIKKELKKLS